MAREVFTQEVEIPFDGNHIQAFEARPQRIEPSSGVIVIHEWWGLNDHIRDVSKRLASQGFLALAPDLFDGRVTKDASEAASMMTGLDQNQALGKLKAAVDHANRHEQIGGEKVGVVGFCMGGSYALLLPIHDARVGASVPFYGQVPGDDVLSGLHCPVLYVYAGQDRWITRDEVDRLDAYLGRSGLAGEVCRYTHADHAFFNDTRPEVYVSELAEDAWVRTIDFFREHL